MDPLAVHAQVMALISHMLLAVDPARAVKNHLFRHGRYLTIGSLNYDLEYGRLFLISVGKAAIPMAQAAAEVLGDAVYAGVGISKQPMVNGQWSIENWQLFVGEHPVAGEGSVRATTAVTDLLRQTRDGDLVLCLISGGTSALLTQPLMPLADWQSLNRTLLASGCTIHEFNTVRRQLDAVKGGGLARLAAPAQVVSLILSDVVGNDLAAIGSGPTVFTDETLSDALAVLERYQLPITNYQLPTTNHRLPFTDYRLPPPSPTNLIIGDVRLAAQAAQEKARMSGFQATILTGYLEGEAREAGKFAAAIAKELLPGQCAILGGETTVTVRGSGMGGRNLELALSAAIALDGWPNRVIATFATDGEDGPTGAAGAVVTGETAALGRTLHLDARAYLDHNDSYTFFKNVDDVGHGRHLLITGPTGTNVNDLIFIIHNS
jgi:hydroxypyruvate reductase